MRNVAVDPALTFENFIDSQDLSFVFFTSSKCGHCNDVHNILQDISNQGYMVYHVDAIKQKDLVSKYSIEAVPTVIVFRYGRIDSVLRANTNKLDYLKFLK